MKIQIKTDRLPTARKMKSESAAASAADIAAQLDNVKSARAAATLRDRLTKAIKREFEANATLLQRFDAKVLKMYPGDKPARTPSRRKNPTATESAKAGAPSGAVDVAEVRRATAAIKAAVKKEYGVNISVQALFGRKSQSQYQFNTTDASPQTFDGAIVLSGSKATLSVHIRPGKAGLPGKPAVAKPVTAAGLRTVLAAALAPYGIKRLALEVE